MTPDPASVAAEEALLPLNREEYPVGSTVRVADMTAVERAWAEAEHEGCDDPPPGHALSDHEPWSGGDLDGVETWQSFLARLDRHGLSLTFAARSGPASPGGLDESIVERAFIELERREELHVLDAYDYPEIARLFAAEYVRLTEEATR